MFSDFQNMFQKIKTTVKQVQSQVHIQQAEYAQTPQKYTIGSRQIQQLKLLSQGAFGFIWLAQDILTKQQFALKRVICMTQQRVRQAKCQKQIMSILPKNDFIVKYYGGDIVQRNSQKVIITLMELCDGGTLFDLLEKRQNSGITEKQLINIVLSILQGLQAIHSTQYYHRDVKIQNVLLGKDRKWKLCDFGSATKKIYDFSLINKKDYDHVKQQMQALTTPMYRPPEIVDPYLKYKVDNKADVWMTGCVLYTLCYFTHPFLDSNAIGIASGTYRFPKYPVETKYNISQKIQDLIRHMLTPNPSYRPSCHQLVSLLKNWNGFNEVPLNLEALKRKKQQIAKQRELQHLNKRVVQFEGDIPIEKLMELQKKVKKVQTQQKSSSFINKKGTQKLKDQTSYPKINSNTNIQKNPFGVSNPVQPINKTFSKVDFCSQQTKKQTNLNDLWGKSNTFMSVPSNKKLPQQSKPLVNTNSFDFFDNFGSSKQVNTDNNTNNNLCNNKEVKSNKNVLNFQEMFSETPITQLNAQKKMQNKVQNSNFNLLEF